MRRGRLRPKYAHGCNGSCGRKAGYCRERKQIRADTDDTKSRAGRCTVGLPAELAELLRQHRKAQDAERAKAAQLWQDGGWVFATPTGRPVNPNGLPRVEEAPKGRRTTRRSAPRRASHRRDRAPDPWRCRARGHGHQWAGPVRRWPSDTSTSPTPYSRMSQNESVV